MPLLPDAIVERRIGDWIAELERSRELRRAPSWGRPFADDGSSRTPPELQVGYRVLANAGVPPPEVDLLRRRSELRDRLAADGSSAEAAVLRRRLIEVEARLAMMLEGQRRRR